MSDPSLRRLAVCAGIEPEYRDMWGEEHTVGDDTLRALLHALGYRADTRAELEAALAQAGACIDAGSPPAEPAGRAWRPAALAGGGRRWGLAVQLYALRTADTWGVGDFSALTELLRGAAGLGAAAVGVNPLHALFPTRPEDASPYSPSSRRFVNPLYLDVAAIEDFATCIGVRKLVQSDEFQARLRRVRCADRVQYSAVRELKYRAFTLLFSSFERHCLRKNSDPRARAFRQFRNREGRALRRFATFHALAEAFPDRDWQQWPPGFTDPDSPAVAAFVARHRRCVEFNEYLQWQAALQLDQVKKAGRACGMSIGLYTDLAVGADAGGAEAWDGQQCLVRGVAIGAPPDALNLAGQNWGLPPPAPSALDGSGDNPIAELWRSNMQLAGALRIDHILGLVRLYWIPAGAPPTAGAYVGYPWRKLLALLTAESRRSHCLLVGEDLGTVPEHLRAAMREAGILCCRLLCFEHEGGRFRRPDEYPAEALVAFGTHDLPSLPMWWAAEDVALRERLGLWPDDATRRRELEQRHQVRDGLIAALQGEGLHPAGTPDAAPVEAVHAYLARTPAALLMVQLEDVLGLHTQINVPGTTTEYPNWRQRLPCTVSEALADPRMQRTATLMADAGRSDR